MKKVIVLTSPKLVWLEIRYFLLGLFFSILVAFFSKSVLSGCVSLLFVETLMVVMFGSVWKRFFLRAWILVTIDEHGISNRYCKILWDEICVCGWDYLYHLIEKKYLIADRTVDLGMHFYFSKKIDQASALKYSLHDIIFIPNHKKCLAIIKQYKPDIIDEIGMSSTKN